MKLEYRKYDLVSNYRKYNMLLLEFEVFFADIPGKKQISADFMYIERLSKKPKNSDFSNFAFNDINNLQTLK